MIDPSDWTKSDRGELEKALGALSVQQSDDLGADLLWGNASGYHDGWSRRHSWHWMYCEAVRRGWIMGPA